MVNPCSGCFFLLLEKSTAVGRCVLTVIFLSVALNKEAAHIQRDQCSFSMTFGCLCLE